jgi:uroporphyrinogen-III synthase/uroporphyrinogen III methyltransferase/synthase
VSLPLTGRRVLVTRAAQQAGKLSSALRELGATPVEVPVLEIQPPEDSAPLEKAIRRLDSYDWLILTSANAVKAVVECFAAMGATFGRPSLPHVASIGASTAAAARDAGLSVALVPDNYVAESLVEELLNRQTNESGHDFKGREIMLEDESRVSGHDLSRAETAAKKEGALAPAHGLSGQVEALKGHDFSRAKNTPQKEGALAPEGTLAGQRILIARAAIARDVIPDALRAAGAQVDVVDAYRNGMPKTAPTLLRAALEQGIDAATFTSSSSVTHLAEAAKAAGIAFPFASVAAISIGPITSQTLREHNWEPAAEANPSDIPGLVAALAEYFT